MIPLDPSTKGRAPVLNLRLTPSRRALLARKAEAKGMTMSAYARSILDSAIDAEGDEQEEVAEAI